MELPERGRGEDRVRTSVEGPRLATEIPRERTFCRPRHWWRPLGAREPVFVVHTDPGQKKIEKGVS